VVLARNDDDDEPELYFAGFTFSDFAWPGLYFMFVVNLKIYTGRKSSVKTLLSCSLIMRQLSLRHITNDEVRSRSNYQPLSSIVTSRWLRFFGHIAMTKITIMPLLPQYASLLRTGESPQGDSVTPGYVRWRQTWDLWTLVFLLRGEKLLGGRTGATSWTRLRSGRVRHKKKKKFVACQTFVYSFVGVCKDSPHELWRFPW